MSTRFEKLVASHELEKRKLESVNNDIERIKQLPTSELERIIREEDEPEAE